MNHFYIMNFYVREKELFSELSLIENDDLTNYYKNSCLVQAGGDADGILDFYQLLGKILFP